MFKIKNLHFSSFTYFFLVTILMIVSCSKDNFQNTENLSKNQSVVNTNSIALSITINSLVSYKNSVHKIFVGYLVGDGADPQESFNPANAPDSVDFLEFFSGNDPNKLHWRSAQAKGTRIVACHFLSDAYFDGSTKDPSTPQGTGRTTPTSTETYTHWARDIYQKHIVTDSIDGIDIDIESGTYGGDLTTTTNLNNLIAALSVYFGPKSTAGLTVMGKKPVLFYDTDGSKEGNSYSLYKDNVDYVLFQSYVNGNRYWSGSGTQDFPPLIQKYGKEKLIFLVNGDNFDGSNINDVPSTSLRSFAQWVKDNNGTGVGAYRMSRDYNHTPQFAASRSAIQIMNPAVNNTTGVIFYQDAYSGGNTTNLIQKGNYTMANFSAINMINDWASSIKIPTGWKVTIYSDDNFQGQSWVLTSDNNWLGALSPSANDVISSFKIE